VIPSSSEHGIARASLRSHRPVLMVRFPDDPFCAIELSLLPLSTRGGVDDAIAARLAPLPLRGVESPKFFTDVT